MPVTPNISLSVPAHNTEVNVWDTDLNGNAAVLDGICGSVFALAITTGLSTTPPATTALAARIIRLTGAPTGTATVNVSLAKNAWTIENQCTSTGLVIFTGGAGNQVAAPPGSSTIYWDGSNCSFIGLGQVGDYKLFPATVAPAWIAGCTVPPWLVCNGQSYSQVTYPVLFNLLQTTTLPDFQGRAFYAADGGSGRITAANSGVTGTALFAAGGAANLTLSQPNLPNVNATAGTTFFDKVATQVTVAFGADAAVPFSITGDVPTVKLNSGVTQQAATTLSPACIGGIVMIRAG